MLRRRTLVGAGFVAALTMAWAGATTWYIASRDELAQAFFARQTELTYGYEDRLADLKGRLEREITGNLVERNGFMARSDALAARQREIEVRQAWLTGMAERLRGGGPTAPAKVAEPVEPASSEAAPEAAGRAGKPVPLDEPFGLKLRSPAADTQSDGKPRDRLSGIERSISRVSAEVIGSADMIRRIAAERALNVRLALEATRLDGRRLQARPVANVATLPSGGPFVSIAVGHDADIFQPVAIDVESHLTDLDGAVATARTLPLGRPLTKALEPTSGFGYRLDPFTRGPALHTGADFRAETGSPVLATASGRVVTADYVGGYGNMVEIEHAGGVSTRYGHLSAIVVSPGALIEAGQVVGRVGSTGRSTGSHLHYEVRIDGEPVNPTRFLEAGRMLAATQR